MSYRATPFPRVPSVSLTPDPDIEEFHAAMKGENELRSFCTAQREEILGGSAADAVAALSTILSDVDRGACTGDLGAYLVEVLRDGLRAGVDGWIDDLVFTRPWGFELDEIRVPHTSALDVPSPCLPADRKCSPPRSVHIRAHYTLETRIRALL